MVSAFASGSSGLGSRRSGSGHRVVFVGKTLNFHRASSTQVYKI